MQTSLRTLRDAEDVAGAIVATSRLLEGERGFLGFIANAAGQTLHGRSLNAHIEHLHQAGVLPDEMRANLHWIRECANKTRHNSERLRLTANEAETVLTHTLRLVEWFYTESPHTAHVGTIFDETSRVVTLRERFEELQKASEEQRRLRDAGLERVREGTRRVEQRSDGDIDSIPVALPKLHGSFFGRELELEQLTSAIREDGSAVAVIVGPAGYGKTELATRFLNELLRGTGDVQRIVYFRCVRGDVSLGRIFSDTGRALGRATETATLYASDLPLDRKLESFLGMARTNVLLVFDNLEDLLDGHDQFTDGELRRFFEMLTATTHALRAVATSRAMPVFAGAQFTRRVDLDTGLPEDLAVAYLRADGAGVGLRTADDALLRKFVQRVHCIPKALESLLGYLYDRYPAVRIDDLLARDEIFANFDRHDAGNGLKRLIREQFDDQTDDAKVLLCTLAIFPKPVSVEAIRYMLPALDWMTLLPRLVRNRLVKSDQSAYELHPLVREHAYSVIPTGVSARTFSRAALHDKAAEFFRATRSNASEWTCFADLGPHLDEFYHRVCASQYALALQVVRAISRYLRDSGYIDLVIDLRQQLDGKLESAADDLGNKNELARCYAFRGDLHAAISVYERVLQAATTSELEWPKRTAHAGMSQLLNCLGMVEAAAAHNDVGLEIALRRRWLGGQAAALMQKAVIACDRGDLEKASRHADAAVHLAAMASDRHTEANSIALQGYFAYFRGDLGTANDRVDIACALAELHGEMLATQFARSVAAQIAVESGPPAAAAAICDEYIEFVRRCDHKRKLGIAHTDRVRVALLMSAKEDAIRHLTEAKTYPFERYSVLWSSVAVTYLVCGDSDATAHALLQFEQSVETERHTPTYWSLAGEAELRLLQNRPAEAAALCRHALDICSAPGIIADTLTLFRILRANRLTIPGADHIERLLRDAQGMQWPV